jgi:hypothetical protein
MNAAQARSPIIGPFVFFALVAEFRGRRRPAHNPRNNVHLPRGASRRRVPGAAAFPGAEPSHSGWGIRRLPVSGESDPRRSAQGYFYCDCFRCGIWDHRRSSGGGAKIMTDSHQPICRWTLSSVRFHDGEFAFERMARFEKRKANA